jgi:hypothetical protein
MRLLALRCREPPSPAAVRPTLAGVIGMATTFSGVGSEAGIWASGMAMLGGTLAAAVNKVEHEEQVGMVLELICNYARLCRRRLKHA